MPIQLCGGSFVVPIQLCGGSSVDSALWCQYSSDSNMYLSEEILAGDKSACTDGRIFSIQLRQDF